MWKLAAIVLVFPPMLAESKEPLNSIRLTNIECTPNEAWVNGTECFLKTQRNRNVLIYGYGFIHRSLTAMKFRLQCFRRHNGFRPYIVDTWVDGCQLFANKIKLDPLKRLFYDIITKHSNVNHTCPFYGEVLVPLVEPDLSMIPSLLPTSIYRVVITIIETTTNEQVFKGSVTGMITSSLLN